MVLKVVSRYLCYTQKQMQIFLRLSCLNYHAFQKNCYIIKLYITNDDKDEMYFLLHIYMKFFKAS